MAVLEKVRAAGRWLAANVWVVVVALVAALGAGIFWGYHRGEVRKLEDEKAIEAARVKVAALDAERLALEERREENAERIAEIQEERRGVQAEIVGVEDEVEGMTDEDLEGAFRELY